MNSDKLDNYFKEQIGSLNTVPVPGANWSPEASWNKINQQTGGRKKLVFWWYLSGFAAVVIVFIAFWFSGANPSQNMNSLAEQNNESPLVSVNEESGNTAILTHSLTEIPVDQIEKIEDEPIGLDHKPGLQENQLLKNNRESYAQIEQLAYLTGDLSINSHKINVKAPRHLKSNIEISNNREIATAFNRTYIIRCNNTEKVKEEKTGKELTLRFDLAMSSRSDPPSGILSKRGK